MKCYHRTRVESAEQILKDGFRDATGGFLTDELHSGVWFSDVPLTCNEGAKGEVVFEVEIPDEMFAAKEWPEEGKPYREALLPAEIVNLHGPPAVVEHDWDECSRSELMILVNHLVQPGSPPRHQERGIRIRDIVLPFLERHSLLAPEED